MRIFKVIVAILTICSIVFLSLSCRGNNASPTPTTQTAKVQKGSISVAVTGIGNLAYSDSKDLAFDMPGTVQEVLVSESDSVTRDQELVKLDTSDWEDQIKTLEKALTTAQRNLETKQSAVTKAQRTVVENQLAVRSAQNDLDTANYNLRSIDQVRIAQDNLDAAQRNLDTAKSLRAVGDSSITVKDLEYYQREVDEAQGALDSIIAGADTRITTTVALQIAKFQLAAQSAQMKFEDAQTAVTDAQVAVTNAKEDAASATEDVANAQKKLDEEKSLSPVIKAPFDGFITKVNVEGGDEITKGTVAVTIADPNQFEATIMVTENDIMSVKVGGQALVSVDALSGLNFPAKITSIAPLATVSQGVVNYKVTAKLTSLTPVMPGKNPSIPTGGKVFSTNIPSGSFPTNLPTGIPANPPTNLPGQGAFSGTVGNAPGAGPISQNIVLKDGLSATVTITIQQVENVLMVPNRAISKQSGKSIVQKVDGSSVAPVEVQTGLTDGTNTQIISGLSENDEVQYKASTASSNFNRAFGGPGMMP